MVSSFCVCTCLFPRCSGLKQLALLSFNLELLSKIHILQDSVSFSLVRESIQLITIYTKYDDFFRRFRWPLLSTWLHWNMQRPTVGLCRMLDWSTLIFFSKSFDRINYDTNMVGLMQQIWEDSISVAARTLFYFPLSYGFLGLYWKPQVLLSFW